MEISYTMEQQDYWRFQLDLIRRSPTFRRQKVTSYLFLPLILSIELLFLHGGVILYLAFLVFGSVIWVGYLSWAQKKSVMKAANLRPGAVGLHTMRLDAVGFREQNAYLEMSVKWEKVTEIYQSPNLVLFLLTPRYGFLVPLRSFNSTDQVQAFVETARAYWRAVHEGTTPELPTTIPAWPPAPRTLV